MSEIMTSDDRPLSPFTVRQEAASQNSNNKTNQYNKRIWNIAENIESDELPSLLPPSSSTRPTLQRSKSILLRSTSLRKSLRRLDSSHRLSITCSGSDLGQLYLSSPETDTPSLLNASRSYKSLKSNESWGNFTLDSNGSSDDILHQRSSSSSSSSWLQAADLYGRRRSYRRHSSYAKFLDIDVMSDIVEEDDYNDNAMEMKSLLIEEADTDEHGIDTWSKLRRCWRTCKSPLVVIPAMMVLDLVLGVSLSLYDSNLLRNVPGFHFPLMYALVQKMTNALASLVLICLSRKWEIDRIKAANRPKDEHLDDLAEMPSLKTFRYHASSLTAVALVQTFSSAFANEALQEIPLPLFKVVLMCGPIFVAFITTIMEGQIYSRGRLFALLLIGFGAGRAVYAEAEQADNPRQILQGAGYALGASACSGIALVLSSVLMHKDEEKIDGEEENEVDVAPKGKETSTVEVETELNPLSLLFSLSCEQVMMLSFYLALDAFDGTNMEQLSEFAAFLAYFADDPQRTIFYLSIGSILSLTLAVLTFVLVNCTSPVATSLLGNVRSISTVAISSILFQGVAGRDGGSSSGGGLFGPAAIGYLLSLAGGVAYAFAALARNNSDNVK